MKKIFKRVLVLACLVLLFTAPTATALAASPEPTLLYVDSNGNTFVYSYQPTAYTLTNGATTQLINIFNTNGDWIVPAYKSFYINYSLYTSSSVRLTVLKMNGSTFEVLFNDVITGYGAGASFTNNGSSDATYRVLLTGQSTATLTSYIATIE